MTKSHVMHSRSTVSVFKRQTKGYLPPSTNPENLNSQDSVVASHTPRVSIWRIFALFLVSFLLHYASPRRVQIPWSFRRRIAGPRTPWLKTWRCIQQWPNAIHGFHSNPHWYLSDRSTEANSKSGSSCLSSDSQSPPSETATISARWFKGESVQLKPTRKLWWHTGSILGPGFAMETFIARLRTRMKRANSLCALPWSSLSMLLRVLSNWVASVLCPTCLSNLRMVYSFLNKLMSLVVEVVLSI